MDKKRILIVTQEMRPYLEESAIANISRELPQYIQDNGMEIRILMPRFGSINERRNRLHEVVRLSGINILINNDDYPLVIKVASLPGARMQVYFLDNEDLFSRNAIFHDTKKNFFKDNDDRMIFFCKGVLDTVKKFGWAPDIIHCHGWMTSLIPLFVKTVYNKEHIFSKSKVVYSIYDTSFAGKLAEGFDKKIAGNNIGEDQVEDFKKGTYDSLNIGAIANSDAVIMGTSKVSKAITKSIDNKKPVLDFINGEGYLEAYHGLYKELINEK